MGRGSSSARQDVQQNELVPEMGCEMEGHEWGLGISGWWDAGMGVVSAMALLLAGSTGMSKGHF